MEQTMPSPPSKQPNASSLEGLLAVIAMQDEKIKDLEAIVEAQSRMLQKQEKLTELRNQAAAALTARVPNAVEDHSPTTASLSSAAPAKPVKPTKKKSLTPSAIGPKQEIQQPQPIPSTNEPQQKEQQSQPSPSTFPPPPLSERTPTLQKLQQKLTESLPPPPPTSSISGTQQAEVQDEPPLRRVESSLPSSRTMAMLATDITKDPRVVIVPFETIATIGGIRIKGPQSNFWSPKLDGKVNKKPFKDMLIQANESLKMGIERLFEFTKPKKTFKLFPGKPSKQFVGSIEDTAAKALENTFAAWSQHLIPEGHETCVSSSFVLVNYQVPFDPSKSSISDYQQVDFFTLAVKFKKLPRRT